ncbi:MAG: sodium:proton antiporter [Planctomycetaceae bacterium TMED240]|nr:sodium:proton antiporter [Rhodopirellula sp.]OUX05283.1 MAG: sodium:proton antiporter [Planctomycetaceae bacterium TMED240]
MEFLLYLAMIPALGLTAQWIAWRTRLPGILLLLVFGMALGHFIQPDDFLQHLTAGNEQSGPRLLFPLVSLSVAVIMLEGGLSLNLKELREAGHAAFRLCTIGAGISCVGATLGAHYILNFGWRLSFLLGAILVVTGPTVIGPLLRQVRPSKRVSTTLKWEGIVIDPIGAVLAVLVFDQLMMHMDQLSLGSAVFMLVETALVGTGLGIAGGLILASAFRHYLIPDHLQGVATLAIGLLSFAISDQIASESGLISVTVLGLWLSNSNSLNVESIIEFKENLRTLLIGCLFVVLGSRVNIDEVLAIGLPGLAFLAVLIFLVRPVSVYLSLIGTSLNLREKAFIAGMAPRGIVAAAVSSVFALEMESLPASRAIENAHHLDTVTFLVIFGTVATYGLAASPLAKILGLSQDRNDGVLIAGADAWTRDFAEELKKLGLPVLLVDTNYNKVAKAKIAGLDAVCANILNEHVREDLVLNGIGKLMALTQNDEVNSLAVRECQTLFGSANLYQLAFRKQNQHSRRGLTRNLMGRELFDPELTYSKMEDFHAVGATFKTTTLSENYTYRDFTEHYQNGAKLLCVIDELKNLSVNTVEHQLQPIEGQTIIALVSSTVIPDSHEAKKPDSATLS